MLMAFKGFGKEASEPDLRYNKWLGGEEEALRLMELRIAEESLVCLFIYTSLNAHSCTL